MIPTSVRSKPPRQLAKVWQAKLAHSFNGRSPHSIINLVQEYPGLVIVTVWEERQRLSESDNVAWQPLDWKARHMIHSFPLQSPDVIPPQRRWWPRSFKISLVGCLLSHSVSVQHVEMGLSNRWTIAAVARASEAPMAPAAGPEGFICRLLHSNMANYYWLEGASVIGLARKADSTRAVQMFRRQASIVVLPCYFPYHID